MYSVDRRLVGAVSVSIPPLLEIIQIVWDLQDLELAVRVCLLSNESDMYCRATYCHTLPHSKYTLLKGYV